MSNPISSIISSMMKDEDIQEIYGKEVENIIDKSAYSSVDLLQKRHDLYARQLQWFKRSVLPEVTQIYYKARAISKLAHESSMYNNKGLKDLFFDSFNKLHSRYFNELKKYPKKNSFNFQVSIIYTLALDEYKRRIAEFEDLRKTFKQIQKQLKDAKNKETTKKDKVSGISCLKWFTTPLQYDGKKRLFLLYTYSEEIYYDSYGFTTKEWVEETSKRNKIVAWTYPIMIPDCYDKPLRFLGSNEV